MPFPKPASCQACPGWAWGAEGFMPEPDGLGHSGVLLLGEALGEQEVKQGRPFIGPAGFLLGQVFSRGGLSRDDFWIDNICRCRPPGNDLSGPVGQGAVAFCPYWEQTIRAKRPKAIVTLGLTATKRVLGLGPDAVLTGRKGWRGYATYSERYEAWVLPTYHPAFVARGNFELMLPLLLDLQHAQQWAAGQLTRTDLLTEVDPPIGWFAAWVEAYERALAADPTTLLAYDIETPTKATAEEDETAGYTDQTYQILRVSFGWRAVGGKAEGVSVPWAMPYIPLVARLLAGLGDKGVYNGRYDNPRLEAAGCPVRGRIYDGMWQFHVLESDQEKALHHAVPMILPGVARWKHEAGANPGHYSALDGAIEWLAIRELQRLLKARHLEGVYEEHIRRLDQGAVAWIQEAGLLVDVEQRRAASLKARAELAGLDAELQQVVPDTMKGRKIYKLHPTEPVEGEVWTTVVEEAPVKVCSRCGAEGVTKGGHTTRKRDNPCHGAEIVVEPRPVERRALVLPFTPSGTQLALYAKAKGHRLVTTRKKVNGFTFDDAALVTMRSRYPADPVYARVQARRALEKDLSTYLGIEQDGKWIGGPEVAADGRVHTVLVHNPSTLRFSSVNPNLQNCNDTAKAYYRAAPGHRLWEFDFRAIEAVLVGYFAQSPSYIRLSKLGVHDFVLAHVVGHPELVDVAWPDEDLRVALAAVKKQYKAVRPAVKTIVHGSGYGRGAFDISRQQRDLFPTTQQAQALMDTYFAICPEIPRWQRATVKEASRQAYLTNPFGYAHRFWMAESWSRKGGKWGAEFGPDAKRALAFRPQSTAAGIIRAVMGRLDYETVGRYLRLQVHDSLLFEFPRGQEEDLVPLVLAEMRRAVPELRMPAGWGLGEALSIDVEAKVGECWGAMEEVGG